MLRNRALPQLNRVSPFQAGSRKGRSATDNLFLLRSCIDHALYLKKPIYITAYDYQQAFDALWLEDCILVLSRLGVEQYVLSLIYKMNKKAVVQIKTCHGNTPKFTVSDLAKQGGIWGPVLCSSSTAEYSGKNEGMSIGTARVTSLAYVDDMLDVNVSPENAEASHDHALEFSHKKKSDYSVGKCSVMTVNQRNSLREPNLLIGTEQLKKVNITKYLGDLFNAKGNNVDLMKDRTQRGTQASVGIAAFMGEVILGSHTTSVYLLLYRSIFISSVLFNSQAWSNLTKTDLLGLTGVQICFLKKVVEAPKSTCNAFVYLELGVLPINYEIHQRQLSCCFILYI